jgi:hypothetical protein
MSKVILPIEVINKILVYSGELNNDLVITQYNLKNFNEYFIINFYSVKLLRINSTIILKLLYPLRCSFPYDLLNRELYSNGLNHYEKNGLKRCKTLFKNREQTINALLA